jgi:hypothetical protein
MQGLDDGAQERGGARREYNVVHVMGGPRSL